MVDISVIMGSESDRSIANRATSVLEKSKYTYESMVYFRAFGSARA